MEHQNGPELQELPKRPTVFMFQPTHFRVVHTPEELTKWEAAMAARVGGGEVELGPRTWVETVCFCGPDMLDPCDCDVQ